MTGTLPTSMTAAAPAATVLPHMTLQPNVAPVFDKSINEKPVTEKAVDRILSDKPADERRRRGKAAPKAPSRRLPPEITRRRLDRERRDAAVAVGVVGRRGAVAARARTCAWCRILRRSRPRCRRAARIADAPMSAADRRRRAGRAAPRPATGAAAAAAARRPVMRRRPCRRRVTRNTTSACWPSTTAR